ncbi:MAG: Zeta toxin family protein [Candidatus Electrothrix sp. EH2]|nr:Zeta toxin family protein [Candidatus Electrothrix sp. EH2]
MIHTTPHIAIIAGPNGAGKSTCGPDAVQNYFHIREFVNADTIAAGISAFQPEAVAVEAGRIMLGRLKQLADSKRNFAFETTLASRSFAPWIKKIKTQGYQFTLVYFWLLSPELAVERVAERVRLGGHNVPPETITRRYISSIRNFFSLYRPIADNWCIYDNSEANNPKLIADGTLKDNCNVYLEDRWKLFESYQK